VYLENVVVDALDPQRLGRFWKAVVDGETLTDAPGIYETRLAVEGGPEIDLCFQPVAHAPSAPPRLHLDLAGGDDQAAVVERVLALGATYADVGQGDVSWVVLADPEGNPFCVLEDRPEYAGSGPVAALLQHSTDPDRDADFWAWLTGWTDVPGGGVPRALRHPSLLGPVLELLPEPAPKEAGAKNRFHLDLRLEPSDDLAEISAGIEDRGGAILRTDWGDLPWTSFTDPSGNELCLLPAPE
jgi:hypothetical protein